MGKAGTKKVGQKRNEETSGLTIASRPTAARLRFLLKPKGFVWATAAEA